MSIKLLNRGKRQIQGKTVVAKDEDGHYLKDKNGNEIRPVEFVLHPQRAIEFDDATGAYLRRLYPGEVVSFEDLQTQFDGSTLPQANAPVTVKMHQNEPASEKTTGINHDDLSEDEKTAVALMRAKAAEPPAEADAKTQAVGEVDKDASELSEAELEALTAPAAEKDDEADAKRKGAAKK